MCGREIERLSPKCYACDGLGYVVARNSLDEIAELVCGNCQQSNDFPPVETQAQVAAAYADRYSGQTRPDTDAVTDSIYGDHIAAHNASDLPWGDHARSPKCQAQCAADS